MSAGKGKMKPLWVILVSMTVLSLFGGAGVLEGALGHDVCEDAIPLGYGVSFAGSTVGASSEGILSGCGGGNDGLDVWHRFFARVSGHYVISLNGSSFDTTVAVFEGCGGAEVACNNNYYGSQSRLLVDLSANQEYLIRVAGAGNQTGTYTIQINLAADMNADGEVEGKDLAQLSQDWLQTGPAVSDISNDMASTVEMVDLRDFYYLENDWLKSYCNVLYPLTFDVTGNGTLRSDPQQTNHCAGNVVGLLAVPGDGWRVLKWGGTDNDLTSLTTNTVTMSSSRQVSMLFGPAPATPVVITINVPGGHGHVLPTVTTYEAGTTVTLTAVPDDCYQLQSWSGTLDDSSTATTNTVYMDPLNPPVVTVVFEPIPVTLTTEVIGGIGEISPSGGVYPACSSELLMVTVGAGYRVKSWQGTDDDISITPFNTVTMDAENGAHVTVELEAAPTNPVLLTTTVLGGHGRIRPSGSRTYEAGSTVTIEAYPDMYYQVKAWTGTNNDNSTANSNTVTMVAGESPIVTVEFELNPIIVNFEILSGQGVAPLPSGEFQLEMVVPLSVSPAEGYRVRRWVNTDNDRSLSQTNTVTLSQSETNSGVVLASILEPSQCIVRAGVDRGMDFFRFDGEIDATAADFENVSSIQVQIWSENGDVFTEDISFEAGRFRGNRYVYRKAVRQSDSGAVNFLFIDLNRNKFQLVARNLNLMSLNSPVYVDISLGDYVGLSEADESVINRRRPIPLQFMTDYDNALRVDRAMVRLGRTEQSDSLILRGGLTTESSIDLASHDITMTWGNQVFTIPTGSFESRNGSRYMCRRVTLPEGGILTGMIDLKPCRFNLTLSQASIETDSGTVLFGLSFDTYDEAREVEVR